ncbi:antirestriction protein ArdA [uncultured Brevundimonas sp.]|uniref:antirestriction protein ArdA n=1 Tax=uncultured Brevundimonas sp. TaxID=213418 RepID=UPI0026293992|nr:antirestriction protein ArdA [uncultured Brevundimonas sp.]
MGAITTTNTDQPRIYVACLAAYNQGRLHGEWIDAAQEPWALYDAVRTMLDTSPIAGAEEWAIHDYEGFGSLRIGEHTGFDRISELAAFIAEHGEIGAALLDYYSGSLDEARDALADRYLERRFATAGWSLCQAETEEGPRKSRSSSTAAAIFRRDHRAPRPARGEFAKAGNAEAEKSINAVADQFRVTSRSLRARGLNTEDPPGRASNRRHRRDTSRQFVRTRTVWSPQPIQIEQTVLNCACTNPDCIIGSFRHSEGSWNKKQPVGEVESSGSSSSAAPCQRRGSRSRICRQCSSPPHERRSLPSWRRSS